jgi:hypothetical protein
MRSNGSDRKPSRKVARTKTFGVDDPKTFLSPCSGAVRHYIGNQAYQVVSVGAADDLSDADGVAILDYWQAQTKAREMMVSRAHAAAGKTGPITVADAMDSYLEFLEGNRKSAGDARYRDLAFIRPIGAGPWRGRR